MYKIDNKPLKDGETSPWALLFIYLGIIIGWIIIGGILVGLLSPLFFDGILDTSLSTEARNDIMFKNVVKLNIYQGLSQVLLFLPPFLFTLYMFGKKKINDINISKPIPLAFGIIVLLYIVSGAATAWLFEINKMIPLGENTKKLAEAALEQTRKMTAYSSGFEMFIGLICVALVPAVCEELLFRGGLQPIFLKIFKNEHIAIFATGVLFSAFHLQFDGFIPRMFLGMVLGYAFHYGGNILISIFFHLINNGLIVVVSYYKNIGKTDIDTENLGNIGTVGGIISLILTAGVVFLLYKFVYTKIEQSNKNEEEDNEPESDMRFMI